MHPGRLGLSFPRNVSGGKRWVRQGMGGARKCERCGQVRNVRERTRGARNCGRCESLVWFASALTKCEPSTNMDLVLGLPPPSVAGQDANPTTPFLIRLESYSGCVSPPKRDATMPKHVNCGRGRGPRGGAGAPAGRGRGGGGAT